HRLPLVVGPRPLPAPRFPPAPALPRHGGLLRREPRGARLPARHRHAPAPRRLLRDGRHPARALREALAVGGRRDRHPTRYGSGRATIPDSEVEDWNDCGQCRDCFNPAFNYRPGGAAQYVLALSNFDSPPAGPRRFRFGFIASSDNHKARPGTGYKEYGRRLMTEATGARSAAWRRRAIPEPPRSRESIAVDPYNPGHPLIATDGERGASFFMTGGLVAVHADGRSRDAIWAALERREVYGTSGDRILLWFDLLN